MKKKFLLFLIASIAIAVYVLAGNKQFMLYFMKTMDNDKRSDMFKLDLNLYGNLYHLCYLSNYRFADGGSYSVKEKNEKKKTEGHLWIIGDSFLAKMYDGKNPSSNLFETDVRDFFWTGMQEKKAPLTDFNKSQKNILLIEMNEYYIRSRFNSEKEVNEISGYYTWGDSTKCFSKDSSIFTWRIVPKTMEQNIETILFGYNFLKSVKESKADFFYTAFGRSARQVFVSPTQNRLFQIQTIDTSNIQSSFKYISDLEIEKIVKNMNLVADHYRKIGFSAVIFSIIPDPASICPPPGYHYNQLIPRIQKNKDLTVDMLDIYNPFVENPDPCSLYWKSDTHWNVKGYSIWENEFNSRLKSYYSDNGQ